MFQFVDADTALGFFVILGPFKLFQVDFELCAGLLTLGKPARQKFKLDRHVSAAIEHHNSLKALRVLAVIGL